MKSPMAQRGLATLAVLGIAGQALILLERAHPGGLDSDQMHEGIIAPEALLVKKATARGVVEKFNCADRQIQFLF